MKNSLAFQIREIIFENNLNFIRVSEKNSEKLNFVKDDICIKYNPITKESILEFSTYKNPSTFSLSDTNITDIYFANGLSLYINFNNGIIVITKNELP